MKMKNRRDIYCEYAFWEAFFDMEKTVIGDRSKRKKWDAFYEFLASNNLYFDIPAQAIDESTCGGDNLMNIFQEKGGAGIKYVPEGFPKFENFSNNDDNRLNAVFLTTAETPTCEELSRNFGVIVFNLSMILQAGHVFVNNGVSFDKSNGQNWTFLWNLKDKCPSINCCNSLLIADRYLLSDTNVSTFDHNLKPIFDALLPYQLHNGIIFNICIIAENICKSIEEKLYKIKMLVEELRPNLTFSLNIFHSKKLHDRSILTNNIILTSGAGFDIIGKEEIPLKFTTTSLYFPFLQFDPNGNHKYIDWIKNVLNVKTSCRAYQKNYWGEKEPKHHLLDYYYEEPVMPKSTYSLASVLGDKLKNLNITC